MSETVSIDTDHLQDLEQLASIAINAFNSILLLDQNGDILWANKGFESLYGYSFEEYREQHHKKNSGFIRILKDTDRNFFSSNASLSFTHSFLNKSDERKWVQTTLTPVFNKEKVLEKFIAIEIDITQQKEVEEELIQKQENTQTLSEHIESVKDYVEDQISSLNEQKQALKLDKEKSEQVLNKVIPYEIAIQLKKKGFAAPRHYNRVSVLTLNIRNFLSLSEIIPIEDLVLQLHEGFVKFDGLLETHYVEKIKTVGGLYLGVGGVPLRNRSNPIDSVLAALQVREEIGIINQIRDEKELPLFKTGIAIHTGKVVAGVVGKNKLTYDVWGDTVNISSLIEQLAPENHILISGDTYEEVKTFFDCTFFNNLNDGTKTYQVHKIKSDYSHDPMGIIPGKNFMQILSKL